jgi:hypothetical protein
MSSARPRARAAAYASTHTESSGTGLATSRLREDAGQIIHDAAVTTMATGDLCGSGQPPLRLTDPRYAPGGTLARPARRAG